MFATDLKRPSITDNTMARFSHYRTIRLTSYCFATCYTTHRMSPQCSAKRAGCCARAGLRWFTKTYPLPGGIGGCAGFTIGSGKRAPARAHFMMTGNGYSCSIASVSKWFLGVDYRVGATRYILFVGPSFSFAGQILRKQTEQILCIPRLARCQMFAKYSATPVRIKNIALPARLNLFGLVTHLQRHQLYKAANHLCCA